ncbi:hypothetical protein MPDQ_003645 [Monascus purpureus]|uniref:DUF7053 domain-containing protein n=1 Tax=Monascus purpureus TaxID=5098 RepID=A0A507R219_MONPU|nr:hypothetical protein MPDQ_003645 [Monascus purpureus]BDD63069.1 hypothetical protein MAP00_008015 [Monascus purpureus]
MMQKKDVYTNITPLPSFIPRQLAIDLIHSHSEIITLNPLVLTHHAIPAPRDAPADEYYSAWYEIVQRIQVMPGMGRLGSSKISFRGCFHNVPWGVQTHIYAPMGIDLRHNYRIGGNQPGEPPESRELGLDIPAEGLYLREDIQIRCNFTMMPFVRGTLKSATKVLVDRLIRKAELLDAGVLRAMMEDGRLKTINPADRTAESQKRLWNLELLASSPTTMQEFPASPTGSRVSSYGLDEKPYPSLLLPSTRKPFTSELPGDTHFQPYHHQGSRNSRSTSYAPSSSSGRQSALIAKGLPLAAELPTMQERDERGKE